VDTLGAWLRRDGIGTGTDAPGPAPVRAFVTAMRGCNNMCSFCVVPRTRGRERSRPLTSLVDEAKRRFEAGAREVTLLGQNVNSFHDKSDAAVLAFPDGAYAPAAGFGNMFAAAHRDGAGARFADLIAAVADVSPELRVRFTSPHPKDFPDALLDVVRDNPNVCNQLHLPAQSGSTAALARMRRGYVATTLPRPARRCCRCCCCCRSYYELLAHLASLRYTREAYLDLAARARARVPGVALSSDFIAGFCGETEAEHRDTVSLLEEVGFEQSFLFAYSRRGRSHAAYHYDDDVAPEDKQRRLAELIATFRAGALRRFEAEVGATRVLLVEGTAKRGNGRMVGAFAVALQLSPEPAPPPLIPPPPPRRPHLVRDADRLRRSARRRPRRGPADRRRPGARRVRACVRHRGPERLHAGWEAPRSLQQRGRG